MKLLPAIAAVVAAVIAGVSIVRGDWGVAIISVVLGAVAVSALLSRRRGAAPPEVDEEAR